jgi:hypothetical protein
LKKAFAVFLTFVIALLACTERKPSNPVPNRPPETHLFLVIGDSLGVPDTTARPDTSASQIVLHWYGEDPDGEIIGYQWAWDDTTTTTVDIDSTWWLDGFSFDESIDNPDSITVDTTMVGPWTFTSGVMDTFYVKIREMFNYFTFYVRAMDNDSALDDTPARMTFPIVNSPPEIQLPVGLINSYSAAHSITLGYQTITWSGSDPDGDETISGYQLALADTSYHWDPDTTLSDTIRFAGLDWSVDLDSLTFSYTFSGLTPGYYRMFLRAYDVAGAYSNVVYYPETTGVWQVIEATGNIIYVDDNSFYTFDDTLYTHILDSLGLEYTNLNFVNRPFYYTDDFELSLNDFDILIYNAGSSAHFRQTGTAISGFINNGGHALVSATNSGTDTTIYSFMPYDSICHVLTTQRPWRFAQVDTLNPIAGYPVYLQAPVTPFLSSTYGFRPHVPAGLTGSGYQVLYTINQVFGSTYGVGDTVAVRFPYNPDVDIQEPAKIVYFALPLFYCNVNGGFTQIFIHVLFNEFADE